MIRGSKSLWGLCVAAAALTTAVPCWAQEAWWNFQWPYRRAVTVADARRTNLAGDDVGVVTMPTAGLIAADGRDIRVATSAGRLVPHRVLMIGPGDTARIAFALRPPVTKYYVYFGNAKAEKPAEELKIRRGVLLEMWEYRGGGIFSLRGVRKAFQRAGKLIGRGFRRRIFLGHNPFGPQNRLCNLFTAYLLCRSDGEYTFATSSQDASFLLIDGKLVVSNGGFHRPQRRASRQGRIRLTRGPHELKLYHVSTARDPVAVVAWKEPDSRRLWAIPPGAFAPIYRATPGMIQRYGKAFHVDFLPVHAGEIFLANRYYQRYTFKALLSGPFSGKPKLQWDFGDGQKSGDAKCEHVYLRNGPHKVTLTVKVAGQSLTRTNRIYVSRPWDRITSSHLDPLADYARIVSGYDFAAAGQRELGEAILLLKRARLGEAILRAGDALVKRDDAPAEVLREAVPIYAETLARTAKDPARAVAALLKGSEMTQDPAVGAALTVEAGKTALRARQTGRALGLFRQAIKKYAVLTTDASIREARIGIGDVWRLRGDYAKAKQAYTSARPRRRAGFEKQAVRKGDLARHAEDYIRRGLYNDAGDFLDKWELEFPAEKLEGYSTLLRVRLAMARRQHKLAADQAEQLVRVNPNSNYAPELLMLASKAYTALDKPEAARDALRRIAKNYPESPLAEQAKSRLGAK